jgi:CRP/FNR family transcriptional regulator
VAESSTSILDLLRHVPYFAGLPDEALTALARVAGARRYARGQVIFLEGEPCAGLFIVAAGEVKISKLSAQGREQILQQLGPGGTFNEVAVLDGGPNPASVTVTADASLYHISRADVRRLAHRYPELAWALIESMARRTRHLVRMVEDLALRSVKARLARLLLAEAALGRAAGEIDRSHMVSQAEMAARLGTVREMVGRALRDLSDEGLIEFDRHRIVVMNRAGLETAADGG